MRYSNPLISIGMPVYNGEQFLTEGLDSILAQTFQDFELIISDNCSTDKTEEICQTYAKKDNRIRYFRNDSNMGAAWNFNQVFTLSHSKYFKWSPHDDVYAPTYLARCVEILENASFSVVLCYPKTVLIDENGKMIRYYDDRLDIRDAQPHKRLSHYYRNVRMCNPVVGLIRSAALNKTRLIDKFVGSDYILLAELALLGEFWEIPEFLFFRRKHSQSSQELNRTNRERAAWFDPINNVGFAVYPFSRRFIEHLKSIQISSLTVSEKVLCTSVFFWEWLIKKNRKKLRCEWKNALKDYLQFQKYTIFKKSINKAVIY